jgi:hypothetical protein
MAKAEFDDKAWGIINDPLVKFKTVKVKPMKFIYKPVKF